MNKFMKKFVSLFFVLLFCLSVFFTTASASFVKSDAASAGNATLKTKIYLYESGKYTEISDDKILECGDIIKVVVRASTDFITGSSSIQVFFDKNYFSPYFKGKAYTSFDNKALESGYIVPCTKANGYNSGISDSKLYLNSIKLKDCGGRVNCGTDQLAKFWPYDWRNGSSLKSEYTKYDYVWFNMVATIGAPNDKNDGKGARLMKISEQDIFAFQLVVKSNKVTYGNNTADIVIPAASVKGNAKYASNKTFFTKYSKDYSASSEVPVSTGFNYNLSDAECKTHIIKLSDNISLDSFSMNYKKTVTAKAKLSGSYSGKKVVWSSSNPSVITVDSNGNVTSKSRGTAKLIANIDGVAASAVCDVNVKFSFGQWLIYIFLFGWIWY